MLCSVLCAALRRRRRLYRLPRLYLPLRDPWGAKWRPIRSAGGGAVWWPHRCGAPSSISRPTRPVTRAGCPRRCPRLRPGPTNGTRHPLAASIPAGQPVDQRGSRGPRSTSFGPGASNESDANERKVTLSSRRPLKRSELAPPTAVDSLHGTRRSSRGALPSLALCVEPCEPLAWPRTTSTTPNVPIPRGSSTVPAACRPRSDQCQLRSLPVAIGRVYDVHDFPDTAARSDREPCLVAQHDSELEGGQVEGMSWGKGAHPSGSLARTPLSERASVAELCSSRFDDLGAERHAIGPERPTIH